jgi:hypothetical protein
LCLALAPLLAEVTLGHPNLVGRGAAAAAVGAACWLHRGGGGWPVPPPLCPYPESPYTLAASATCWQASQSGYKRSVGCNRHRSIPVISRGCVEGSDVRTVGVSFDSVRVGLGRIPVKLFAWICAPFVWKVVRQRNGYTYFENAVTGRRRCRWDGIWDHVDYSFMRSGNVSCGPLDRQVFD